MQKLTLQSAWKKTIAEQDLEKIKRAFLNVRLTAGNDIQFTSLWQAKNHRRELLIAVLIHNTSEKDFHFYNQKMRYEINSKTFTEHSFSPLIVVGRQTSMPWTFIFPVDSFDSTKSFENGELYLVRT